jgi:RimJ/RimL family protein N-acetyltransferase
MPTKTSTPGEPGTPIVPLIETPRLAIRVPQPADLVLLQARVFADREVMRHVDAGGTLAAAGAAAFFDAALDHDGSGRKPGVLIEKATGEVIGYAGPRACAAFGGDDIEIGFVLARAAWGKGYAAEIGRGQLAHAFGVLGCRRVLGLAAPDNTASIATLRRIGMAFTCSLDLTGRGRRNVYVALAPAAPVEPPGATAPRGQRLIAAASSRR